MTDSIEALATEYIRVLEEAGAASEQKGDIEEPAKEVEVLEEENLNTDNE